MSPTVSYGCWPSLTLPQVPWICCVSLTVSMIQWICYISLTVSSSSMGWLHFSHCNFWLLALCHCLSQCNGVAVCLSQSTIVAACFSQHLPVPCRLCMSPVSPIVAGCLSLSLLVPWSCCMSLDVFHCCWLSLNFSLSSMELRDSNQQQVIVIDIQLLNVTRRHSEKMPETMRQ